MNTASPNAIFNYLPGHPRKRRIRRIVLLVTCLAVIGVGWKWGPPLARQATYLYWQHRCMTYQAPPGKMAFEEDPVSAAQLLQAGGEYTSRTQRTFLYSDRPPKGWEEPAFFHPRAIDQVLQGPRYTSEGVAFMHGRRASEEEQRFVRVSFTMSPPFPDGRHSIWLAATTFSPATWAFGSRLAERPRGVTGDLLILIPATQYPRAGTEQHPRVFVGQPDPADESRFTISYELDGRTHIILGQLQPNDQVTLIEGDKGTSLNTYKEMKKGTSLNTHQCRR